MIAKIYILRDMAQCIPAKFNQCFREIYCLHFQYRSLLHASTCFLTWSTFRPRSLSRYTALKRRLTHRITRCYIPGDTISQCNNFFPLFKLINSGAMAHTKFGMFPKINKYLGNVDRNTSSVDRDLQIQCYNMKAGKNNL
jgi:hypothetical protein